MIYKKITGYVLLIFLTWSLVACDSSTKQGNEQEKEHAEHEIPAYYKYFQGKIGDKKAILQLIKYQDPSTGSSSEYRGTFIDENTGRPLPISGKKDSSGTLTLVSYIRYNPIDTLTGSFPDAETFKGSFHDSSGLQVSFSFKERTSKDDGNYQWEVHTLSDSLAYDSSSSKSPKARINYLILWPVGNFSPAQKGSIIDTLAKAYFGVSNDISRADVLLRIARDSFLASYQQAATEWKNNAVDKGGPSFNWVSMAHTDLLWNADSLISLEFTQYNFTGGAHGLESVYCTVFDMKQDKVLTLNDIFKPGYEKPLQKILEKELRQEYDIPANKPLDGRDGILFNKELALTTNFYLTGKGIGFIYNPYEVAPYVVGQIELYIPFSWISDILKNSFTI